MANPYIPIASIDSQAYDFISEGRQIIKKRVRFDILNEADQIYNLALCTVSDNGSEDFETISRNGDMNKVFETIGKIVLDYTNKYPDRKIYFAGSDSLRTRQYQLSLFSNMGNILAMFIVEGLITKNNKVTVKEIFKRGKNYDAFIFTRKED